MVEYIVIYSDMDRISTTNKECVLNSCSKMGRKIIALLPKNQSLHLKELKANTEDSK